MNPAHPSSPQFTRSPSLFMVLTDTADPRDLPSNMVLQSGVERQQVYELTAAAKAQHRVR